MTSLLMPTHRSTFNKNKFGLLGLGISTIDFSTMESVRVIFEGPKVFWKTRVTLDIVIVEHTNFGVLEVIAFDAELKLEAPRLYIDQEDLQSMINQQNFIQRFVSLEKEKAARQNEAVEIVDITKRATDKATADYILDRICVMKYSKKEEVLTVEMQFDFSDRDLETEGHSVDKMVIARPSGMKQFEQTKTVLSPEKTDNMIATNATSGRVESSAAVSEWGELGNVGQRGKAHHTKPSLVKRNTAPMRLIPAATFSSSGNAAIVKSARINKGANIQPKGQKSQNSSASNSPRPSHAHNHDDSHPHLHLNAHSRPNSTSKFHVDEHGAPLVRVNSHISDEQANGRPTERQSSRIFQDEVPGVPILGIVQAALESSRDLMKDVTKNSADATQQEGAPKRRQSFFTRISASFGLLGGSSRNGSAKVPNLMTELLGQHSTFENCTDRKLVSDDQQEAPAGANVNQGANAEAFSSVTTQSPSRLWFMRFNSTPILPQEQDKQKQNSKSPTITPRDQGQQGQKTGTQNHGHSHHHSHHSHHSHGNRAHSVEHYSQPHGPMRAVTGRTDAGPFTVLVSSEPQQPPAKQGGDGLDEVINKGAIKQKDDPALYKGPNLLSSLIGGNDKVTPGR